MKLFFQTEISWYKTALDGKLIIQPHCSVSIGPPSEFMAKKPSDPGIFIAIVKPVAEKSG